MKLDIPAQNLKQFAVDLPDGGVGKTLEDIIRLYCSPNTVIGYGYNGDTHTYEVTLDDTNYHVML